MQTILHIGLPKTGTSYLQKTLYNSREYLTSRGVLYPKNPTGTRFSSHKILASLAMEDGKYTRDLHRLFPNEQQRITIQAAFLKSLAEQRARHQFKTEIISAEHFSTSSVSEKRLQELFKKALVTCSKCVFYFRRPSADFLSRVQQALRSSHKPPDFYGNLSTMLRLYTRVFDDSQIAARLYDRETMIGNDIVQDFFASVLPELDVDLNELSRAKFGNETLSSEAAAILQSYRFAYHKDKPGTHTLDTSKLVQTLRKIDDIVMFERPELQEGLADAIDYSSKTPLLLRDRFGLEIPDFDYACLEQEICIEKPEPIFAVEDLIKVDPERKKTVLGCLAYSAWAKEFDRAEWAKDLYRGS